MWESKLFRAGMGILLVFLIIYIGSQITFIFRPLVVAFEALFISFLISGILYYFTYPLCDWLSKRKVPRPLAIIAVFILVVGMVILLGLAIGPILADEFTKLAVSLPGRIDALQQIIENLEGNPLVIRLFDTEVLDINNITERLASLASATITRIATSVTGLFDYLTNFFITIVIVPFLLYYMLREKGKNLFSDQVARFIPQKHAADVNRALAEMNKMLAAYFQGLGLVCLLVGILAYIGFLIIGLEFALILSIFILVTNIVPFIGPFIGAIPAAFVGLLDSPLMMLKVIVVIVIVQQLESLVISPQVMGRKMALSPL
ncbi:MAG: AI-2E family transporter, partial [Clostridia bacterium]|nr:AI-2E family transporter [Clostridia bacterium]